MRAVASALLTAALLSLTGSARAEDGAKTAIVFARDSGLFRVESAERDGAEAPIATLPEGVTAANLRAIEASDNGAVLLLDAGGAFYWLRPSATEVRVPRPLKCISRPHLAPDGSCVVCVTDSGTLELIALNRAQRAVERAVPAGFGTVEQLGFLSPTELAIATKRGIRAVTLPSMRSKRTLAPHSPSSELLVAPSGARAVGLYRDKNDALEADGKEKNHRAQELGNGTLFTFRLDGTAALRRLNRAATPLEWSLDSEWLLLAEPDAACIVRAVGGEFKCWSGYRAVTLSPDGKYALLGRDHDGAPALYRAELDGPRTTAPRLVIANASVAAWLPWPQPAE